MVTPGPTYSEVGGRQGVGGAAVLADDGGGVSQLTVVVTSASNAGQLADGGSEDHLDPSCVVYLWGGAKTGSC